MGSITVLYLEVFRLNYKIQSYLEVYHNFIQSLFCMMTTKTYL